jgi:hypothetical protein
MAGNEQTIASAPFLVPPGAPLAPFIEARLYAIANVAMHDALNGIVPRFERYADTGPIDGDANLAAAVLTAAHDAIVGADPSATVPTDLWYAGAIAPFTGEPGYADGVTIGQRAAAAILALRASDGTAGGGVGPYTPGTNPGDYQFTFPFNTPPFDFFGTGGFADASHWGEVTPFVVTSTSQFRAKPPYHAASNAEAVLTKEYTKDFNEVKALGCLGCASRTAKQTEIALFWMENSPTGWNRAARVLAADNNKVDAWDAARLFALLQMGQFDAYAVNFDSKYYYNFWRPVSAVALAGTDGNPNTDPAGGWEVLAFPTPPVPDYPSAHSAAGGAGSSIIDAILPGGPKKFSMTSGSLPGVTRSFKNTKEAARENALSRIYIGYHFRLATEAGIDQGDKVGDFIAKNALRPLKK